VLRFRDAVEPVGEAQEDASAHQSARGGGELGMFVVLVGRFDEILQDTKACFNQAVTDGEAVLAGELHHPLDDPLKQVLHTERDHRSYWWCGSAAGGSAEGALLCSRSTSLPPEGDQGVKDQESRKKDRLAIIAPCFYGVLAHRAPKSLKWLVGSLASRTEESRNDATPAQLPPRITRAKAVPWNTMAQSLQGVT
jgi:hypothetical protein